jgi:hypothetical protein
MEHELLELYDDIVNRRYKPRKSICFVVENPVKREVFAADFRDRVVHHLIFNYINPVLECSFIEDSYSCRQGKGTLYGIQRIYDFINKCSENYTRDCYILKLDIQGYFMNINKPILKTQLQALMCSEKISLAYGAEPQPDWETVWYLMNEVIDQDVCQNCIIKGQRSDWQGLPRAKSLFHTPKECGLPIGNLTSQLFSNVYLHPFDVFMKQDLNLQYYGRYVDDFVVVDEESDCLKKVKGLAGEYLKDNLQVCLHPGKVYLQHYAKGVKFLGAVLKPGRLYVARRAVVNMQICILEWDRYLSRKQPSREDLHQMRASINSFLGIMKHFKTYRVKRKILFGRHTRANYMHFGYLTGGLEKFVLYDDNAGQDIRPQKRNKIL